MEKKFISTEATQSGCESHTFVTSTATKQVVASTNNSFWQSMPGDNSTYVPVARRSNRQQHESVGCHLGGAKIRLKNRG